jgi:4-hydroxy-tetrahydrodipicolinate reductase
MRGVMMSARPTDLVTPRDPLRAAVWGTGHMGVELTKACLRRGDVVPVAAIVTSSEKDGLDLGEIAGVGVLGAPASTDADRVLARDDIDVVFYAGIGSTEFIADALGRTVDAGKDGITFSALAHPGTALGPEAAGALDERARSAGKHILGTGLAPGFITDVLAVAVASTSVDWTAIRVRVVVPMDNWGALTLDAYGIGKPPGGHAPVGGRLSFLESVATVIDALGVDVASSEETWEPVVSERVLSGGAVVVGPGTVGGVTRTYRATTSAGRTVTVELAARYMLDEDVDGLREEYSVEVDGGAAAGARASLTGGWSPDPYPATAACGLNALPGLRSLPPGMYTAAQVPFAVKTGVWRSVRV